MNFNRIFWVLIGFYASLWFLMGPYRLLCVLKDTIVSLWILIGPFSSLKISMGLCGSL